MYFQFLIEDQSTEILVGHVMGKLKEKYPEKEILYDTVRRYIKRKIKPQNGWQWFLEKDNNWIKHIDNGKIK